MSMTMMPGNGRRLVIDASLCCRVSLPASDFNHFALEAFQSGNCLFKHTHIEFCDAARAGKGAYPSSTKIKGEESQSDFKHSEPAKVTAEFCESIRFSF